MFTLTDGERKQELGCSRTGEERGRKGPGGAVVHAEKHGGCGVLLTQGGWGCGCVDAGLLMDGKEKAVDLFFSLFFLLLAAVLTQKRMKKGMWIPLWWCCSHRGEEGGAGGGAGAEGKWGGGGIGLVVGTEEERSTVTFISVAFFFWVHL